MGLCLKQPPPPPHAFPKRVPARLGSDYKVSQLKKAQNSNRACETWGGLGFRAVFWRELKYRVLQGYGRLGPRAYGFRLKGFMFQDLGFQVSG